MSSVIATPRNEPTSTSPMKCFVEIARPSETASATAKTGKRQRGRTSASAVAAVQIAWDWPDGLKAS